MARGVFVTGTDTGVGKTVVSAGLLRSLRGLGVAVAASKPVATGSDEDAVALAAAAGDDPRRVTPFVLPVPAAPTVSARLAGAALTFGDLLAAVRAQADADAFLLVEGVGGLLCPLADGATVAELAAELGLPLLVVARRTLGTLNHTLLTLEVARHRGLSVAGVVLTATVPSIDAADAECEAEMRRLGVPLVAVLPHRPGAAGWPELDELARLLTSAA